MVLDVYHHRGGGVKITNLRDEFTIASSWSLNLTRLNSAEGGLFMVLFIVVVEVCGASDNPWPCSFRDLGPDVTCNNEENDSSPAQNSRGCLPQCRPKFYV